jgi:hypothetical protein
MKRIIKWFPQELKSKIKAIFKLSPTKNLEIKRIHLIRSSSKDDLQSEEYVENLLCNVGLNNEELFNYPKELYKYCGNGLYSWQYPIQFGNYLIELSKYSISSYLEIGTKHGGTFIITVEYLNKFNSIRSAIGVDLFHVKGLNRYKKYNKNVKAFAIDSHSVEFKKLLNKIGPFDLVLIDGDHSYEGCLSDFLTIKDHAKIFAFHDIVGMGVPGVVRLWNELKTNYSNEFNFLEFTEQYQEVTETTGKTWLGIGLALKK